MDGESTERMILDDEVAVTDIEVTDEDAMEGHENEVVEPRVGMKFDDLDKMVEYFKKYGKKKGFPVKKRSTQKDDDGVLRYVVLSCSRSDKKTTKGSNMLKERPSSKFGCKAKLTTSLDADGKWQINKVNLDHNHVLLTPSKTRYLPCNRELDPHVKRQLEIGDISGISAHKIYTSIVVEKGGHENVPCVEKDCSNYIAKMRRLRLGEGDALAVQNYFLKMQEQNSGFFFNIDLDDTSQLRNVFWADGRSREAYKEFGDVVTFDTTYLTNKYSMPFAPFVGVNHHGQSILFGCALVSNEDTDTFVWLFQTWLACMAGNAPQGFITDQDRAMQKAVHIVFPNTSHRWCLWHIMKKVTEKLKGYNDYDAISTTIASAVYDSQTKEEFEKTWSEMIDKYTLHQNEWLSGLYIEKQRWVPCFVKDKFWAGMSTTQRSESMNAFFDDYVDSKTTLKQFVEQYDNALKSKVEKENFEDFNCLSKMIACVTTHDMEKQVRDTYTMTKFREFLLELTGVMYCVVMSSQEVFPVTEYTLREDVVIGEYKKRTTFKVLFDSGLGEVKCSCQLFEFKGMLCRHAIAVFIRHDVTLLPDKYILRRWRKDITRSHTSFKVNYNGWCASEDQKRYDKMCLTFTKVADTASTNEVHCNHVMEWISAISTELSMLRLEDATPRANSKELGRNIIDSKSNACGKIRNPKTPPTKGRPRKTRLISTVDKHVIRKRKRKNSTTNGQDSQTSNPRKKAPKSKQNGRSNTKVQFKYLVKDGKNNKQFPADQVHEVNLMEENISLCLDPTPESTTLGLATTQGTLGGVPQLLNSELFLPDLNF